MVLPRAFLRDNMDNKLGLGGFTLKISFVGCVGWNILFCKKTKVSHFWQIMAQYILKPIFHAMHKWVVHDRISRLPFLIRGFKEHVMTQLGFEGKSIILNTLYFQVCAVSTSLTHVQDPLFSGARRVSLRGVGYIPRCAFSLYTT